MHFGHLLPRVTLIVVRNSSADKLSSGYILLFQPIFFLHFPCTHIFTGSSGGESNPWEVTTWSQMRYSYLQHASCEYSFGERTNLSQHSIVVRECVQSMWEISPTKGFCPLLFAGISFVTSGSMDINFVRQKPLFFRRSVNPATCSSAMCF